MSAAWLAITLAAGWVVYAYAGYPLVLLALRRLSPRPVRRGDVFPRVSIVIAVHDGARELEDKLTRTLALDYPGEREVIVSSDGSTDETEVVARAFAGQGVVLVASRERRGKETAQAAARAAGSSGRLRWPERSTPNSFATRRAVASATAPCPAARPADETTRSGLRLRIRDSAKGLRQMFPWQSTRMLRIGTPGRAGSPPSCRRHS